jgi:shikimate kinase
VSLLTPSGIALVGMPGSGKSTVGRQLARLLGWPFVDSDAEIVRRIGMPIRAFFEQSGEAAFRALESQVLAELLATPGGVVVATGGGAVLRPENRELLKSNAQCVYLRASVDELWRRLRHDTHRPLLQVADPHRKLRDLFHERDPLYREVARHTVESGRTSVHTLAHLLRMQLEMAGAVPPADAPGATAPPAAPPA